MEYSLDMIKPNLRVVPLQELEPDNIVLFAWRKELERIMPEMKKVLFGLCHKHCGKGCETLCQAGESVAWNLSQIRFATGSLWN